MPTWRSSTAPGRLAEITTERNLPAVIATAEMSVGERHRLMSNFLGTLYQKNRVP
jgi:hypothetical protein